MSVYHRLRPGIRRAGYDPEQLYPFLRKDSIAGFVFIERLGRPCCVQVRDFERIDDSPGE